MSTSTTAPAAPAAAWSHIHHQRRWSGVVRRATVTPLDRVA
ncbi:hypothetical protein [Micromonospora aurantiaca]|nr:hypothetical protein [Micromonospora aurantiaca]